MFVHQDCTQSFQDGLITFFSFSFFKSLAYGAWNHWRLADALVSTNMEHINLASKVNSIGQQSQR